LHAEEFSLVFNNSRYHFNLFHFENSKNTDVNLIKSPGYPFCKINLNLIEEENPSENDFNYYALKLENVLDVEIIP